MLVKAGTCPFALPHVETRDVLAPGRMQGLEDPPTLTTGREMIGANRAQCSCSLESICRLNREPVEWRTVISARTSRFDVGSIEH